MAGRVAILDLQGLSQSEKFQYPISLSFLPINEYVKKQADRNLKINIHELYNIIWRGSFPKLVLKKDMDRNTFYSPYLQTYIERDIREISIVDKTLFLKFITVLAARTGQELNYTSIANDVGVSQPTIKSWISLLKTSGLIYLISVSYKKPKSACRYVVSNIGCGSSGSGTIIDFLREFDSCTVHGFFSPTRIGDKEKVERLKNSKSQIEMDFSTLAGNLFELERLITSNNFIMKDAAVKRFIALCKWNYSHHGGICRKFEVYTGLV